jgi:hypothetical protein
MLLVGNILEIIKSFKWRLPLAAFRAVVFCLSMDSPVFTMQSGTMYYFQHLLTLKTFSFSSAYKTLEKVPCGSSLMLIWFPDWGVARVRLQCWTHTQFGYSSGWETKILWMPWDIIKDKDPACQILGPQIQVSNQPLLWLSSPSPQHHRLTTISMSHVPNIHARPYPSFQKRVS